MDGGVKFQLFLLCVSSPSSISFPRDQALRGGVESSLSLEWGLIREVGTGHDQRGHFSLFFPHLHCPLS